MRYTAKPGATLQVGVSHPARVAVFVAVARRPRTAPEAAAECGRPLGTVAYHLRALAEAGLVGQEEVLKAP